MKLLELNLLAFGPFTDHTLCLGKQGPDFHVIYGDNEAGKSSTLRALHALFYGVPTRTTDNFLHPHGNLRIGGHFRDHSGRELRVIRRKGRKRTLNAPDGEQIADASFERFLGGVDEARFLGLFGLDHEALAKGAEEVLKSGGEVGQSLFAASLGSVNPRGILDTLEAEAEKLFKPRGQTQTINKLSTAYKESTREIRQLSLSSRDWSEHASRLEQLNTQAEALSERIQSTLIEQGRLEAIQSRLAPLARRRELQTQLEHFEHQGVVVLAPEFSEQHGRTVRRLEAGRDKLLQAERQRDRHKAKLTAIDLPTALLEEQFAITTLYRGLGGHHKNLEDTTRLSGKRGQLRADAHAVLEELGRKDTLDTMASSRPDTTLKTRVRELTQAHGALSEGLEGARRRVAQLSKELDQSRAALMALGELPDPEPLRASVTRIRQLGDLEAAWRETTQAQQEVLVQAEVSRLALGLWTGALEEVELLAVPTHATVERFTDRDQSLRQAQAKLVTERTRLRDEAAGLVEQLAVLQGTGEVPTEQDLWEARESRSKIWQTLRRDWQNKAPGEHSAKDGDGAESLVARYEDQVLHADVVADRLRREADRVAHKASLTARQERLAHELELLDAETTKLRAETERLDADWLALWSPLAISPLPPREMASWLTRHHDLTGLARRTRELSQRAQSQADEIASRQNELRRALEHLGTPAAPPEEGLNGLLDRSERLVTRLDEQLRSAHQLGAQVEQCTEDLANAEEEATRRNADYQHWQRQWRTAVTELALPVDASPAEVNAVLDKLADLYGKLDEAAKHERRIEAMTADVEAYRDSAQALCSRIHDSVGDGPIEHLVEELHEGLTAAKERAATAATLQVELETLESDIADAKDDIALAETELAALCVKSNCTGPDDLLAAINHSAERHALETELAQLDSQLMETGGGSTVAELIAEAAGIEKGTLPARIEELSHRFEEQRKQRTQLDQDIGRVSADFARLDGSAAAAEAAERAQSHLSETRVAVNRYVRVRLAAELLRREIERYRRDNQGPVLTRAQSMFRSLTLGSFHEIRTDYDAHDQPVLVGVRESGEKVGVAGMSEGTRDQLYLALRLATLERYLEAREPFPLIIDDLLVHFDDQRSAAALGLLAELAQRTQVLFFTHHRRLVEQAKELPKGCVQVHELGT